MKHTMQRTLAFVLICVMLLGMMPISAMAAGPEAAVQSISDYPVIELNTETTASITRGDGVAYFSFTPTETAAYTFYSTGGMDTYGYICDSNMYMLADDDDAGSGYNFSIDYTLHAGTTYILCAKLIDCFEVGDFPVMLTKECSHQYTAEAVEPECHASGVITYTCQLCGHCYEEQTPALGHIFDGGTCTRCGKSYTVISLETDVPVTIDFEGDVVFFVFTPTETGDYTFCSIGRKDTYGYLYNAAEQTVARDNNSGEGDNFSITYTMQAGKSYIMSAEFYEFSDTGNFIVRLGYACNHDYIAEVTEPTCTNRGYTTYTCTICGYSYTGNHTSVISHNFEDGVCTFCGMENSIPFIELGVETIATIEPGSEIVLFSFIPTQTAKYTFCSSSAEDTYGYIYDSSMNIIATDDDSGVALNFSLTHTLEAGTLYFLGARYYNRSDDVSFPVMLTKECLHSYAAVDTPPTCVEEGYTTYTCTECGDSYTENTADALGHNFDVNVCTRCGLELPLLPLNVKTEVILAGSSDTVYFSFTPTVSGDYTFYSSSSSDTIGYIYDSDFNLLLTDDDSGDNRNFAVTRYMEAGTSYILGARFYYEDVTGSFTVTLIMNEPEDPQPEPSEPEEEITECGDDLIWTIVDNVLIISGNGDMYDFDSAERTPWHDLSHLITEVVVGEFVTYIGENAFSILENLTSVTFQGNAPAIASNAFEDLDIEAYYPITNGTWTDEVMENYGGQIVWIPFGEVGLQIVRQPADFIGMVGDTATFTVEVNRDDATYQWYFSNDGGNTWQRSSCTTNTLTVEFMAYRLGYMYRCEVTDSEGSTVVSAPASLMAQEMELTILTQPVSYVGAVNDELNFTVEASGNGVTYEWYYSTNGGETWTKSYSPGFATNTLSPILRAYRDGNMYKCVVSDIFGSSVESEAVSMTVKASEVIIVSQPQSVINAVIGQLYGFSVVAEGDNLTYRWELSTDGGETWQESWNQGYNTANLNVRMNPNRDGNMYRCCITSGLKVVAYSEAVMLDMQDPSVNLVGQSGNVYVTANETATFTVEAEGMDLNYLWYRSNDKGATWNQTFLSGYDTNTLSFVGTAARAALFMCKITDGSGTVIWSEPVKLQILSAELKILAQPVSMTCADGETVSFTVSAQGDTLKYQWYGSTDGLNWEKSYLGGYNTDTFSFDVNAARAAKIYKCVITDAAGNTVETDPVTVTIA